MMKNGVFVISLDFELHWGVFDKVELEDNINYFENTRKVIPKMLDIFKKSEARVTWATVGMLFLKNVKEWKLEIPEKKPSFTNTKLSAYSWMDNNERKLLNCNCHFAPDLVDQVQETEGQELSSHTFSHYYCLEEGQKLEEFENDLKAFRKQLLNKSEESYSLVFPRNQYNKSYLEICSRFNVKIVRTNPKSWFWNELTKETLTKKVFRTLDCYIPISKTIYPINDVVEDEQSKVVLLPASRFLKPVSKFGFLNKLRLHRIKNEMTKAAKENKMYHLWWHPHNYGNHPEQSIKDLKSIIDHYIFLSKKYKMESLNMIDIYNQFFNNEK